MAALDDLTKEAKDLSHEEREILADRILQSLDEEDMGEIDRSWLKEAQDRYQKYLSGKTGTVPLDDALSAIRRESSP